MAAEVCQCGHDLDDHPVWRSICVTCGYTRLSNGQNVPNGFCMGWDPTQGGDAFDHALLQAERGSSSAGADVAGPAVATTPTGATAGPPDPFIERLREQDRTDLERELRQRVNYFVDRSDDTDQALTGPPHDLPGEDSAHIAAHMAGPPDLDQAIHAAEQALRRVHPQGHWPDVARIAVEAAAFSLVVEADKQLQATKDRLADLQVYAAELYDLLEQVWTMTDSDLWHTQPIGITVRAALDLDVAQEEDGGD